MSKLYIRLRTSFWTHRKTARLVGLIGNDAYWIMPRLWCYAAENQPDGDFSKYTDQEICMLVGCLTDASSMLQAMIKAGYMGEDRKLHAWEEHNAYHHVFSERAKKAANARHHPPSPQTPNPKDNDIDIEQAGVKHTSSMLQACSKVQICKTRLNKLFKRRETTSWDVKEIRSLKIIMARPEFDSELLEIEKRYTSGNKFVRQDMQTLFNNWSGELDRHRRDVGQSDRPAAKLRPSMADIEAQKAPGGVQ